MNDAHFLMDALTDVDDELIAQAESIRPRRSWKAWVAAAAAVAIVVGSALLLPRSGADGAPPLIPSTDTYVNHMITLPAFPYEQGYVGNPYTEKESSNMSANVISEYRLSMTAKAVEILPDTYQMVGQQQGGFRLVRMEFIRGLGTEYSGKYFYYPIPPFDDTDLTKYDAIVIFTHKQYGHSGHVLYNATQECLTAIDLPLVGGFLSFDNTHLPNDVFAFTDGAFDPSLWNSASTMKYYIETSLPRDQPLSEVPTLSEFEAFVNRHSLDNEIIYDSITPDSQEIADAQNYVRPFENGIFIPSMMNTPGRYRPEALLYRRYAGGYPTNETVQISPKGVTYSSTRFIEEDLAELPDLASALAKVKQDFDAGLITPGHIRDWEDIKFITHSIFGWYHKTDSGVYGVIRVSWCYHGYREDNDFDVFHDDQYFLIELGSDTLIPVEREELAALGGVDDLFMVGRYGYDEYGRKYPPIYGM